jgi:ubiquinone/menaquinone biosynthesis C-methylase UbiE
MISRLLSIPGVFQLQQKLCNNYGNVREEFADYLREGPLKVLDVGCSSGVCGQALYDTRRDDYTGIDITESYVEYAKRAYPTGKYLAMDGRKLAFPDQSFDVVSFIGVLHHMDDDTAVRSLAEARRVLKQSGVLLVAEPVFTPNKPLSNLFLSLDRGQFIRESGQYEKLVDLFRIERRRYFGLSLHRFISIVARPAGKPS